MTLAFFRSLSPTWASQLRDSNRAPIFPYLERTTGSRSRRAEMDALQAAEEEEAPAADPLACAGGQPVFVRSGALRQWCSEEVQDPMAGLRVGLRVGSSHPRLPGIAGHTHRIP